MLEVFGYRPGFSQTLSQYLPRYPVSTYRVLFVPHNVMFAPALS
jgi:hypothetical protein